MKKVIILFVATFLVLFATSSHAAYIRDDEQVTVPNAITEDALLKGEDIHVNANVSGELFAVGGNISISERISRSIFAAGRKITINQGAGYNIFSVAGQVVIKGVVEHDVYIMAQKVTIDPSAHIKGDVRLYGNEIIVGGSIDGAARIEGVTVTSTAKIGESLFVTAEELTFSSGEVSRDLIYSARTIVGLDKVKVGGAKNAELYQAQTSDPVLERLLFHLLAAFVTGAAILLLFRPYIERVNQTFIFHWGYSLLVGVLGLVGVPILGAVLIKSQIGAPLAIALLSFYVVLLIMSAVLGQFILGNLLLSLTRESKRNWWLALALGALIYSLIQVIPNAFVMFLLVLAFGVALIIPALGATVLYGRSLLTAK